MAFIYANPNPRHVRVGDCTVRAISLATGMAWEDAYAALSAYGFMLCDMPTSNDVWGQYLDDSGFSKDIVHGSCPHCTIKDFARENPEGVFVLGTGTHVVCVINGDYLDTWDSGDETPIFVWRKK